METTGIWDSHNNRHATVEHETMERLMDYSDSGFRAGFAHGMRILSAAMTGRQAGHEPWSAPMPSLREHLESYGGIGMTAADFDRCEKDWYRMLGERRRMFDRYLTGMRCARYVLFGVWILVFAIVGLILVEVSW